MSKLSLKVRLRLLPTEHGGRKAPVFNDYRPSWNLGNTWNGQPTINDGRVLLDGLSELAPGSEGPAFIEPFVDEFWGAVDVGAVLPMQEGARIVGYATVVEVTRPEHFTRETAAFVDQAHQFCDFVKRASTLPLTERLTQARLRLLELYKAGSGLPLVEPPEGIDAGPNPPRPGGWEGFDRFEVYWEVFDPYVDEAPVAGSL